MVARFLLRTLVGRAASLPLAVSAAVSALVAVLALLLGSSVFAFLWRLVVSVTVTAAPTTTFSPPAPVIVIFSVSVILRSLGLKVRPVLARALVRVKLLAVVVLAGIGIIREVLIRVFVTVVTSFFTAPRRSKRLIFIRIVIIVLLFIS